MYSRINCGFGTDLNFSSHCRSARELSAENPNSTGSSAMAAFRSGATSSRMKITAATSAKFFMEPLWKSITTFLLQTCVRRVSVLALQNRNQNDGHGILPEPVQMQKSEYTRL